MTTRIACWCGNAALVAFYPGYLRCSACDTLVSSDIADAGDARVGDGQCDQPGGHAGSAHREDHRERLSPCVRSDMRERGLHWLQTLLAYKVPPARVLEMGGAHGTFAAVLRLAGFDAMDLEKSPPAPDFSRATIEVPMLFGPLEAQSLETGSFDAIALIDALGHLADPMGTVGRSLDLLKPDGIVLVQTPCHPAEASHDELSREDTAFLEALEPRAHRYLFSQRSLRDLFRRLGARHLAFEPALFPRYTTCAVASRLRPDRPAPADQERILRASPGGQIVQALLDQTRELDLERQRRAEAEEDRSRRLLLVAEQGRRLGVLEAEGQALRAEVMATRTHLAALQEQIPALLAQLRSAQTLGQIVLGTRTYRALRALGRWKFVDRILDATPARERRR